MASSRASLEELHSKITESLTKRIQQDNEDGIPTDAATLSAAIKFLKDNNVTADPAAADDLKDLQDKLAEQARERRARAGAAMSLVKKDMAANG